jgi:uncharacterized protein (TIGR03067 family)
MSSALRNQILPVLLWVGITLTGTGYLAAQTPEIQKKVSTSLERQRLEGTWRPVTINIDGKQDKYQFTHQRLIFKGTTFERTEGKAVVMKGTYEIDPTMNPQTMDLSVTEPKPARPNVKQVYEVKGDLLRVVTAKEGRATDLNPGKDRRVVVYRREYTTSQLLQVLALEVEVKDFRGPMTFKEFLGVLQEAVAAKGKVLPVVVDLKAFREDDPAAANIYDTQITFQPGPLQKRSVSDMLHAALGMFNVGAPVLLRRGTTTEIAARGEPALVLREGDVVITTRSAANKDTGAAGGR